MRKRSGQQLPILAATTLCASAGIAPMLIRHSHISDFAKGLATGVPIGLCIVILVLFKLTMRPSS